MFKSVILLFIIVLITNFSFICQAKTTLSPAEKLNQAKNNLYKNLYKANGIQDLSKLGVQIIRKPQSIMGRSGPASLIDVKEATPGKCDPKPVCITNPLVGNLNPNQVAFPQCINIHRCDGCCPPNEKCEAIGSTEVKLKNVGVINFDLNGVSRFNDDIISVQNHTECECKCKWESDEDCRAFNPNFVKHPDSCECVCPEELFCGPFHEFDKEACNCKCRRDKFERFEQVCKMRGFSWNNHHCRCDQIRVSMSTREVNVN